MLYAHFSRVQPQYKSLIALFWRRYCRTYEILIQEDFKRIDSDGAGTIEQIDGVIEFDASIFLVEMKWHKDPIGVEKIITIVYNTFAKREQLMICIEVALLKNVRKACFMC